MKRYKVMTIFIIIAVVALIVCATVACSTSGGEKYSITYDSKGLYRGAKDSYAAGQSVTLHFPHIATDTSYSFYLNGVPVDKTYTDFGGYKLTFVMPPYDAKLECVSRNDMVYIPPEEGVEESLLCEYYEATAAVPDGKTETYRIALYNVTVTDSERNQEDRTEVRVSKTYIDGTKEENVYDAKFFGAYECTEIAKEYYMHGWDTMKNTVSEDGMLVSVKLKTDTGYITVSNGCMPENGKEGMHKIRDILEGYTK